MFPPQGVNVSGFSAFMTLIQSPRLLRPISGVRRSRIIGADDGSGTVVSRTMDDTPIIHFRFEGALPATVQISDGTDTYTLPITGSTFQIVAGANGVPGSGLADGIWTATSQAENSNAELDQILGQFEIITSLDASTASFIPGMDASHSTALLPILDASYVNG